ncbi:MAG: hypothetical protein LBU27_06945 [Candidatus Peribacteria bacterium]|jgi:prefoldin subunit 5|nr:hypothetical protein [Candidatus Peribacteria bacterium]
MKTTQPSLLAPVWQGALWGLGLLIITSIGIVSFRHFSPTPSETVHNAAEETGSDIAMLQQEIPTLYQGISGLQNELSGLQNEVSTLQSDTTLTEQLTELEQQIATLQSGFSTLQSGFSTLFPLGSFIAVNGTIDQATMNARGWALCDGSAINSQVKDAVL